MRIESSQIEVLNDKGDVVRKTGDAPTGNPAVDATFDNLVKIDRFVRDVLHRNGIDHKGRPMRAQLSPTLLNNATIAPGKVVIGTRPGADAALASLGYSPGVVCHEFAHFMDFIDGASRDRTGPEAVAVQESWPDIMAVGVDNDWVLGNEIPAGTPEVGADYRDLRNPPAKHMSAITKPDAVMYRDVLSYTAVLVADAIGKDEMIQVWYRADGLLPNETTGQTHPTNLEDFAKAAVAAAEKLRGADSPAVKAVTKAFATTGIYPRAKTPASPVLQQKSTQLRHSATRVW